MDGEEEPSTTRRNYVPPDWTPPSRYLISVNTGISIGVLCVTAAGIWAILSAIYTTKAEINARLDKVETRVTNIETGKNTWTLVDMYKWTVHLQQSNPPSPAFTLKVPEPEARQ